MDVRRNFTQNEKAIQVFLEDGRKCWYEVVIYGGSKPTGIDAIAWAKDAEERGAGEILLTSMETDGTKNGFDIAITSAISDAAGIPVIASGGVGTLGHFYDGFTKGKADACLAASVFHYGEFTVQGCKRIPQREGYPGTALISNSNAATECSSSNAFSTKGWISPKTPTVFPATTISPRRPSMNAGSADSLTI